MISNRNQGGSRSVNWTIYSGTLLGIPNLLLNIGFEKNYSHHPSFYPSNYQVDSST